MPDAEDQDQIAAWLAGAQQIVVLTGAGISTESGIPDFRSPGGVWSKMKPIYFQEFVASEEKRREAWARTFKGSAGWTGAKPNAGHYAVARLVNDGKVAAVITQILPNGNMVIEGRQEVRVNFEVREVLVAGIVRPEDITPANTIPHEKIAQARIAYGGRGQITDVQQPRYGQQVLDVILPF